MSQYDYNILKALESMATSLEKIERDLAMIQTGMITTKPTEQIEDWHYNPAIIKEENK